MRAPVGFAAAPVHWPPASETKFHSARSLADAEANAADGRAAPQPGRSWKSASIRAVRGDRKARSARVPKAQWSCQLAAERPSLRASGVTKGAHVEGR